LHRREEPECRLWVILAFAARREKIGRLFQGSRGPFLCCGREIASIVQSAIAGCFTNSDMLRASFLPG